MYIGRFAPTPSGDLHIGSLCVAIASYARAKNQNGKWILRIEDLDTNRNIKGASERIINQLESFGFIWDELIFQSKNIHRYCEVIENLKNKNLIYACSCTRSDLKKMNFCYNQHCRELNRKFEGRYSIRLKNIGNVFEFNDILQNKLTNNFLESTEDFILKRSDGIISYNLSSVIDDHDEGITEIVRGADLIPNTTKQINLMNILGYKIPNYLHIPLILDQNNKKYSKQNHAPSISQKNKKDLLMMVLQILNQQLPSQNINKITSRDILDYAIEKFNIKNIPTKNIIVRNY